MHKHRLQGRRREKDKRGEEERRRGGGGEGGGEEGKRERGRGREGGCMLCSGHMDNRSRDDLTILDKMCTAGMPNYYLTKTSLVFSLLLNNYFI